MLGKLSIKFAKTYLLTKFENIKNFYHLKQSQIYHKTWFQTFINLQNVDFQNKIKKYPKLITVIRLSLLQFLLKMYELKLFTDENMDYFLKSKLFQIELNSRRTQLAKLKIIYEFVLNQAFCMYKTKTLLSEPLISCNRKLVSRTSFLCWT